jgi:predicted secreted protein
MEVIQMAAPTTASWTKFIIQLGDGGGTEVFTPPCGLTSKGIAFSATTAETAVPDCANPSLPAWIERDVRDKSATITGSGILAMEARETWWNWYSSGAAKNCRVKIDAPMGGHWAGSFQLTALEFGAGRDDGKIQLNTVTLMSDGEVIWVDASP